jgi:hypothetical protein
MDFGFLRKWRERIVWEWEYGTNKYDKASYRLEFTSKPIPDSIFKGMSEKYVKQATGKSIDEVQIGDSFELSPEIIKHNAQILLIGLPKIKITDKLLTKEVREVSYKRGSDGWVVFMAVEGIRRLF